MDVASVTELATCNSYNNNPFKGWCIQHVKEPKSLQFLHHVIQPVEIQGVEDCLKADGTLSFRALYFYFHLASPLRRSLSFGYWASAFQLQMVGCPDGSWIEAIFKIHLNILPFLVCHKINQEWISGMQPGHRSISTSRVPWFMKITMKGNNMFRMLYSLSSSIPLIPVFVSSPLQSHHFSPVGKFTSVPKPLQYFSISAR